MAARKTICPHCNSAFALSEKLIGKRVKCKKCSSLFVVAEGIGRFIGQAEEEVLVEPLEDPSIPAPAPESHPPVESQPITAFPAAASPPTSASQVSTQPASSMATPSEAARVPVPPVSPYENLAAQLSASPGAGSTTARDYVSLNRKFLHEDSRTASGGGNGRFVFRGLGLIGFGLVLFGLSLLNLHLGQMNWLGLVACVISVACGLLGALMVMIGGRDRVLTGLVFGGGPGLLFLGLAALGGYLGMQDHWGVNGYWSRYSNQVATRPPGAATADQRDVSESTSDASSRPRSRSSNQKPRSTVSRPPSRRENRPNPARDMQEEFRRRVAENQREIDEIFGEAKDRLNGFGESPIQPGNQSRVGGRPSMAGDAAASDSATGAGGQGDDDPFAMVGDDDIEAIFGTDSSTSNEDSGEAFDDNNGDEAVVRVPGTRDDTARYNNVMNRRAQLVSEAMRKFKTQAHDLPEEYRTGLRGVDVGSGRYEFFMTAHSQPMLGLDATVDRSGFTNLIPVFERDEASQSMAREGYAVGGVRLFDDGQYLRGVQLVFMKIQGKQLDPKQYYKGPWVGEAPTGQTIQGLSGEGRMIYGVYHTRGRVWANLGLVKNNR